MSRGRLRVLLGAAPGVGKTYAMLEAGRDLAGDGKDVVVAVVETHGRAATAALGLAPRRDWRAGVERLANWLAQARGLAIGAPQGSNEGADGGAHEDRGHGREGPCEAPGARQQQAGIAGR